MSVSMRKRLSLMFVFVLILGLFAGCSSKTADSADSGNANSEVSTSDAVTDEPAAVEDSAGTDSTDKVSVDPNWESEPIELTYWYTYAEDSAERTQFLDVVLPLWAEKHPNVTINAVARESGETYHQQTVTAITTGSTPDLARIDIIYTAAYADLGALLQLDAYSDFDALKETLLAAPLATNFYGGGYYGLPLDTNCKAAVVNTDIMKAMGITDGIPDTMEELIAAAEAYVQSSDQLIIYDTGLGDWDFNPYFWLFGGVLTNDDYTVATGYLDSEASVNAINTLKGLVDKGIFSIHEVDGAVDAWSAPAGTYAMFFEGPWYFGAYDENQNPVVVPALIPSFGGKTTSVVGGQDIVVFSSTEYPDAAYEFAKFLCSEEVQQIMLDGAGIIPVNKAAAQSETVTSDPVLSIFMEQIKSANVRIPSPNTAQINQAWKDAMTAIFLNGADVQETLTTYAGEIDDLLSGD